MEQIHFRLETKGWGELAQDVRQFAAELPAERTKILQGMRETVHGAVLDQYYGYPDPDHGRKLPPAFYGTWGTQLRVWVQPQMGAISVRNDSPHAAAVEFGRPPGPVSLQVIDDWAFEKLGTNEKRVVRAIWKRIVTRGYAGHHVIARATSPYAANGTGPDLHQELGRILREQLAQMIRKYGWR